jgi:hypothetical protein
MRFAPMRPTAIAAGPTIGGRADRPHSGSNPLEGRSLLGITAGGPDTPPPPGGSSPSVASPGEWWKALAQWTASNVPSSIGLTLGKMGSCEGMNHLRAPMAETNSPTISHHQ